MQKFPEWLGVEHKNSFVSYNEAAVKKKLRKEIYEHMLQYDYTNEKKSDKSYMTENNSFDINSFFQKNKVAREEIQWKIVDDIAEELRNLGWQVQLAFHRSVLFVYSSEKLPTTCWSSDF